MKNNLNNNLNRIVLNKSKKKIIPFEIIIFLIVKVEIFQIIVTKLV